MCAQRARGGFWLAPVLIVVPEPLSRSRYGLERCDEYPTKRCSRTKTIRSQLQAAQQRSLHAALASLHASLSPVEQDNQ